MTNKYFLYARKSTDETDKQVRSIDDQIAELRLLAEREGLSVVEELIESETAKRPGRPKFNRMLERIERGEADGILAWHPDRLARNSLDGGKIVFLIDSGTLNALKFSTFWFEPTPQGKLMLAIAFGMSKYYVDKLSEDVRRGLEGVVREGRWATKPPLGYIRDPKIGTIAPDRQIAPMVRKMFEIYSTGQLTIQDLRRQMTDSGLLNRHGKPIAASRYHAMLRAPVYCGLILYRGEIYEGKHEPIVTRELFDSVQVALRCRGCKQSPRLKPYLYRGMFRCGECGSTITMETQKGHVYLRCTKRVRPCSQPYVRQEEVALQVTTLLHSLSLPSDVADELIGALQAERRKDHTAVDKQLRAVKEQMIATDAKIDRVLHTYLDGHITLEEYHQTKNQLMQGKQRLKQSIDECRKTGRTWFEPAIRFVQALKTAFDLAERGSDSSNRDFLRQTGSNLYLKDKHLAFEPHGPWKLVVGQGRLVEGVGSAARAADVARPGNSVDDVRRPYQDSRRSSVSRLRTFFSDATVDGPPMASSLGFEPSVN